MKNREERSQHFFDTSVPLMDDGEDNTLYDRVGEGLQAGLLSAPCGASGPARATRASVRWLLQQAEERSWGPHCFFLSRGHREALYSAFQNLPESSLHTPCPGRAARCTSVSPVVWLLRPCVAADTGLCPLLGQWCPCLRARPMRDFGSFL